MKALVSSLKVPIAIFAGFALGAFISPIAFPGTHEIALGPDGRIENATITGVSLAFPEPDKSVFVSHVKFLR